MANGTSFLLGGTEVFYWMVVMGMQLSVQMRNFKGVSGMVCELCLNKVVKKIIVYTNNIIV